MLDQKLTLPNFFLCKSDIIFCFFTVKLGCFVVIDVVSTKWESLNAPVKNEEKTWNL
jgi:hypothetical protein